MTRRFSVSPEAVVVEATTPEEALRLYEEQLATGWRPALIITLVSEQKPARKPRKLPAA